MEDGVADGTCNVLLSRIGYIAGLIGNGAILFQVSEQVAVLVNCACVWHGRLDFLRLI